LSRGIFASDREELIYLTEDEINDEKVTVFKKERGSYLEKEEALQLIDKLVKVYRLNEINELIDFRNNENRIYQAGFDFVNQGRYMRCNFPVYKFKEFNRKTKTKRVRKMTCDFCGKEFTSETQDGYYKFADLFMHHQKIAEHENEQACSEFCIKKIWSELLDEWLKREGLLDFVRNY